MGKRRHHRNRNAWWRQSIGGITTGALLAIVGVFAVVAIGVAAFSLSSANSSAASAPDYTPRSDLDFSTPDTRPRLATIGDSWSGGAGSRDGNEATGMIRLAMRAAGVPGEIFGEGGTGYTSDSTWGPAFPDRLQPIIDMAPSAVLIQGSANDYGASAAELRAAAERTYDSLAAALPGVTIVVLGPLYSTEGDNESVDEIRATLREAAEGRGVQFIDPVEEGWLPLDPALYSDGYHPNAEGHRMIAERLTPILEALPPRS